MARNEGWSPGLRMEIARALDAVDEPLTMGRLADAIERHPSNLSPVMEALVSEGLVGNAPPPRRPGRGRPATIAFALTDEGRASMEAARAGEPGQLSEGDHLVLADASPDALFELLHVAGDDAAAVRASWTCMLGGLRPERAFAFRGPDAARGADDLMAVLTGARIANRHLIVSDLGAGAVSARDARRRADLARRARMSADTRSGRAAP